MYTAITYPMLQLEWTTAKVLWYLLMQASDAQSSLIILLSLALI